MISARAARRTTIVSLVTTRVELSQRVWYSSLSERASGISCYRHLMTMVKREAVWLNIMRKETKWSGGEGVVLLLLSILSRFSRLKVTLPVKAIAVSTFIAFFSLKLLLENPDKNIVVESILLICCYSIPCSSFQIHLWIVRLKKRVGKATLESALSGERLYFCRI